MIRVLRSWLPISLTTAASRYTSPTLRFKISWPFQTTSVGRSCRMSSVLLIPRALLFRPSSCQRSPGTHGQRIRERSTQLARRTGNSLIDLRLMTAPTPGKLSPQSGVTPRSLQTTKDSSNAQGIRTSMLLQPRSGAPTWRTSIFSADRLPDRCEQDDR